MDDFNEQYKDPRWHMKRKIIYERDRYECRRCGDGYSTLHAHHLYYDRRTEIWNYDNDALVTLCEKCHSEIHSDLKKVAGIVAFKMITGELDIVSLLVSAF